MAYILIMLVVVNGQMVPITADFNNELSCIIAKSAIVLELPPLVNAAPVALCIQKGATQ